MTLSDCFGILFLLMIMQLVGTHFQIKKYRKTVSKLHKLGNIGVGGKRGRFGPGSIVIIACKNDGTITGGEIMRGITIFSGFNEIEGIVGKTIYELKEEYINLPDNQQKFYQGHIQALEILEKRLSGKVEEAIDEK